MNIKDVASEASANLTVKPFVRCTQLCASGCLSTGFDQVCVLQKDHPLPHSCDLCYKSPTMVSQSATALRQYLEPENPQEAEMSSNCSALISNLPDDTSTVLSSEYTAEKYLLPPQCESKLKALQKAARQVVAPANTEDELNGVTYFCWLAVESAVNDRTLKLDVEHNVPEKDREPNVLVGLVGAVVDQPSKFMRKTTSNDPEVLNDRLKIMKDGYEELHTLSQEIQKERDEAVAQVLTLQKQNDEGDAQVSTLQKQNDDLSLLLKKYQHQLDLKVTTVPNVVTEQQNAILKRENERLLHLAPAFPLLDPTGAAIPYSTVALGFRTVQADLTACRADLEKSLEDNKQLVRQEQLLEEQYNTSSSEMKNTFAEAERRIKKPTLEITPELMDQLITVVSDRLALNFPPKTPTSATNEGATPLPVLPKTPKGHRRFDQCRFCLKKTPANTYKFCSKDCKIKNKGLTSGSETDTGTSKKAPRVRKFRVKKSKKNTGEDDLVTEPDWTTVKSKPQQKRARQQSRRRPRPVQSRVDYRKEKVFTKTTSRTITSDTDSESLFAPGLPSLRSRTSPAAPSVPFTARKSPRAT